MKLLYFEGVLDVIYLYMKFILYIIVVVNLGVYNVVNLIKCVDIISVFCKWRLGLYKIVRNYVRYGLCCVWVRKIFEDW